MEKEYIRIKKPPPFSADRNVLKTLDDGFWKNWIFYHLFLFYKNFDREVLKHKIEQEKKQPNPRVERKIAYFIRKKLNANSNFSENFHAFGENSNDEEVEGYYDITVHSTNWKSKNFHFECKNLTKNQDLINKYVYYHKGKQVYDGGVYRYFNKKYAQQQDFGGMIGFVLEGDTLVIKNKILKKLGTTFDTTPEGDLIQINNNSIEDNDFTFDSYHNRENKEFIIHHLLFNLYQ
jgi:hypothetical protein